MTTAPVIQEPFAVVEECRLKRELGKISQAIADELEHSHHHETPAYHELRRESAALLRQLAVLKNPALENVLR